VRAPQRPFSRIVVAVDSSAASERAVRLAVAVASGDARSELIFCHVIDIPWMLARADHGAEDYEIALETAQNEARRLLDRCIAAAAKGGVFGRSCLRYGKPADEVAKLADAFAADLVVVGNRPSGRLHRILNGSVRDEIVRMSALPVLVAERSKFDSAELREECVLAELADAAASKAVLRAASAFASGYRLELVCLPGAKGLRARSRAIELAVVEFQPALLVIGAPSKRNLRDRVLPTIVERTLEAVNAPVLVVHY
jgi:nucleotide-binding universal stress UspA family protein